MRGSIVKRGRNSWAVVISLGRDPQTDRKRQKWFGRFETRANAQTYLNHVLSQIQDGTWTVPTKKTLAGFLDQWMRDYAASNVRPTTFASYDMIARKHLVPALGHVPLTRLTPQMIQGYFTEKREAGLSSTTIRHHGMLLHKAVKTAVRWGLLSQNPVDRVDLPRNREGEMRVWDEEQAQMFLAEARRSSSLFRLYVFVATTGVRMGEGLGLAWKHLSLTMGTASIVQTVYWLYGSKARGEQTRLLFKEPKSKKSRRQVPLLPEVIEELAAMRKEQDENRNVLGDRYHDHGLVYCQANGTPLHPSDVRKDFYRVLKRAGLPRIRFHDLRHTAATLWLRRGVHPKVVQELLGHSTAAFTLQVYSHVLPGLKEQAVNELGARLLGRIPAAD
jgi:integrase